MKYFSNSLFVLPSLLLLAVQGHPVHSTAESIFEKISESPNITWTSCFDGFGCSRLQVPLDYANPSIGTTSIAFIKLQGKNTTESSPSIVIIPGGPGGSGIDLLLGYKDAAGQAFGEQYNYISFDPRGVKNSGPSLDCFLGDQRARSTFLQRHETGTTNVSSDSLPRQYYSSFVYGEACNHAVQTKYHHSYYVTTPAVATDLLTFVEAEARARNQPASEAKLWSYGISYGTAVAQTFATMFPDRVGRMILDGVINTDEYYTNEWAANVLDMDATVEKFASLCHAAGSGNCVFWGPSTEDILKRLDTIIRHFQNKPDTNLHSHNPNCATYSDLKELMIDAMYNPPLGFPHMATVLNQIEHGNSSALVGLYAQSRRTSDAGIITQCADTYRTNKVASFEGFKEFVQYVTSKSKYTGDIWPMRVETVLCTKMRPNLPQSMTVKGPLGEKTAFPILFTSNTIDPVTPSISARKMAFRYPGSKLLLQDAVGHTVMNQGGSDCYFHRVQLYLQGGDVPTFTVCPSQNAPFM